MPRNTEVLDLLEMPGTSKYRAKKIEEWLGNAYSDGYLACSCENPYDIY